MAPVLIDLDTRTLRRDPGEDEIEVIDDLDTFQGPNMCACAASDDNPY